MKILRVGLTGGYGTGKTTVLRIFERLGAEVLSSDDVVHHLFRHNRALQIKIRRFFGDKVFAGAEVDRRLLGRRVFASPRGLKKLNALVHPLVKREVLSFFKQRPRKGAGTVYVVEVPLLFEAGFDQYFDRTIVVAADLMTARGRLFKRSSMTKADIRRRSIAQWGLLAKIRRCDFVIDNNGTQKETLDQVKRLMKMFTSKEGKI